MVPFWGTLNIRGRIIIGTQKGTIIFDNHPFRVEGDTHWFGVCWTFFYCSYSLCCLLVRGGDSHIVPTFVYKKGYLFMVQGHFLGRQDPKQENAVWRPKPEGFGF